MGKLAPVPLLDTRRIVVALGGVIAAVAGALAGMGTPRIELPRGEDVPGGAVMEEPLFPGVLQAGNEGPRDSSGNGAELKAPGRAGRIRRAREGLLPGIQGWVAGPTGPLEGAPVDLVPLPRPGEPRQAEIQVLSGPGGRFAFRNMGLTPGGWALWIHPPGFGIRAISLESAGLSRPFRVNLAYGRWVTGRALSSGGKPVGLGRVWVGLPLEGSSRGEILWRRGGRTSREGRFVVRDLPPERPAYVLVDHPLYAPSAPLRVFPSAAGNLPPLRVSLVEGRRLRGRVLSRDGSPKARLFLFWEERGAGGLLLRRGASTDGEGNFLLQGLPWNPPPSHLWVSAPRGGYKRVNLARAGDLAGGKVLIRLPW